MSNYGRITGLSSGLDTENMIKQMMKAEEMKIDRVKEKQQLEVWRQDKYRDVSSMLIGLKSEYMDILKNESNLKSPKTFNVFEPNIKVNGEQSKKISISVSGTLPQDLEINSIERLASNHKLTSKNRAKQMLSGVVDQAALDKLNAAIANGKTSFRFSVDGVERTVSITPATYTSASELAQEFNEKFKEVFGQNIGEITLNPDHKMQFNIKGHNARFVGADSELENALGFGSDVSNVITRSTTLKDLGIRSKVHDYEVKTANIDQAKLDSLNSLIDSDHLKLKFKIDDVDHEIQIEKKTYANATELASEINQKLKTVFPDDSVVAKLEDGAIKFISKDKKIEFLDEGELSKGLEINGKKGLFTKDSLSVELSINGATVKVREDDTIEKLMSRITTSSAGVKMTYDEITGKFQLISENTGHVHKIKFDNDATNHFFATFGLSREEAISEGGEDALFKMNGETLSSFTNTINKNGISLTLNQTHSESEGAIKVNYTKNTDDVVKKVKEFVNKYNDIFDKLSKLTKEQKEYKYKPLSAAQKKEMEKEEIEKWEEKAKSGLLKGDIHIEKVLRDLRSAFLHNISDSGLSAQDIGLKLTSNYREGGKIVFDETKFKSVLEKNPSAVTKVFTEVSDVPYAQRNAEKAAERFRNSGLMQRISDVIEDATRTSSINNRRGYFVEKAGIKGTSSESLNELSKNIKNYDKKIQDMFEILYKKEDRLYKQFARLESLLQKANSQSANFMSMMGGK